MAYIYEMCPHCLDELIERKQPMEDLDSINYCPKCGKKMVWAIGCKQKIDDTIYKIILKDASHLTDHLNKKNKFLEEVMKMGNITYEEAVEKCKAKNCLIFEGNTKEVYIKMNILDSFTPQIRYKVVPDILFERFCDPFISICPTCGSDVVDREGGTFCEKCNEWVLLPPL